MVRPAGLARASAIVTMSAVAVFAVPGAVSANGAVPGSAAVTDTDLVPEHVASIYDYAAATAPCPVSFATLAGIGAVTSDHTRVGGDTRLLPDGNSRPTIVYEQLAPSAPSGLLPDTDGGVTDGSTEADTTIGPMQFLPETWAKYGVDGNGDGTADPNNLWDAASSAANRLCDASVDTDLEGALTAYFGTDLYNDWVAGSIAEAAEWQAVARPNPERRDLDVISIAPAATEPSASGALISADDATTTDTSTATSTIDTSGTTERTAASAAGGAASSSTGAEDDLRVAGIEQIPAAAPVPGFIGPPAPTTALAEPVVAPGDTSVSGDWDGSGAAGRAVLTIADGQATISRTDAEGRPYGRAIDVSAELADPAVQGGLAVGDWDGDGIDDLALLVAASDGVTAIRLDRAGRVIDSADLGLLSDGATIVVGPAPVIAGLLGDEAPWKTVTAHDGRVLDLWKVGGIIVDASLVEQTSAMLAAAAADGVTLEGWGWRSHDAQIELRRAHCADVWTTPASECSPPTAIPGTSRHEYGTAIDFHADTVAISATSPAYVWLAENAEDFGYFNLPSEPWHWSVDGG